MTRADLHFRLRLPADLKARIETEAVANGRSINAEIIRQLSTSSEKRQLDRIEAALSRIEKAIAS